MARFWLTLSMLLAAGGQLASAVTNNYTKSFTTSDGDTYAYDYIPAQDSKPTVLLLHGYPSSRYDWRYQIADLSAAGFGVLAPDSLGYGDSDKPVALEAYSFKRLSGHVIQLLEKEKLESVIGVGHDWGSTFLSRVAVWHPDRFSKLAFMAAGYSAPGVFFDVDGLNALGLSQLGYMQLGYWYFLNSYNAGQLIGENLDSFFHLAFPENNTAWAGNIAALGAARQWLTNKNTTDLPTWMEPADKNQWINTNKKANATEAPLNYYRALMRGSIAAEEAELTDKQKALNVPVLGLGGKQDLVTRADQLRGAIEPFALKGYTEKLVDAGHWVQLEQREQVSKILLEFVSEGNDKC